MGSYKDESKYFDNVLIKLQRTYSKDEAVAALSKKLSDTEIELGKQISYVQELEDEKNTKGDQWFEKYTKLKKKHDIEMSAFRKNQRYKSMLDRNKKLQEHINRLSKDNGDLILELQKLRRII